MVKIDSKIWDILNEVREYISISEAKELLVSLVFLKYANEQYYSKIDIPKQASWEFLYSKIYSSNFYNDLLDAFKILEIENSELKGTFSSFDFRFKENKHTEFISVLFH